MKWVILATIIWRVTGIVNPASGQVVPQAQIECKNWHKDWCGMRFTDCKTGSTYECVTNVEVLKQFETPLTEEEKERIREQAESKMP